ncbi:hypothetical protein IP69_14755 [Bosea sp. AAP35]|nr:hypothetical protein IP69_14755 [Bosea sp. AAP35]
MKTIAALFYYNSFPKFKSDIEELLKSFIIILRIRSIVTPLGSERLLPECAMASAKKKTSFLRICMINAV